MLLCRAARHVKVNPPRFREKSNSTHRCCLPRGSHHLAAPCGLRPGGLGGRGVPAAPAGAVGTQGNRGPGSVDHSWEGLPMGQGHPDPRPPAKPSRPDVR